VPDIEKFFTSLKGRHVGSTPRETWTCASGALQLEFYMHKFQATQSNYSSAIQQFVYCCIHGEIGILKRSSGCIMHHAQLVFSAAVQQLKIWP